MSLNRVSNHTSSLLTPETIHSKKRKFEKDIATPLTPTQDSIPSQYASPLSKEGREVRKRLKDKAYLARRPLSFDQREYGTTLPELSRIYNIDFVHPPVHSKMHEFFSLGEMMMQIECGFKDRLTLHDLKPLRERLLKILSSNLSHKRKMAELGTYLYLLDRDRTPPSDEIPSYTDFRAEEMRMEVVRLLEVHQMLVDSEHEDNVPSGKTHYILRTFSRMILTYNQKLNKGALYAILQILENASSSVPGYLKPEHHAHILCIIRQVISNPAFETLIETPFLVHPDLEALIRIDLKLPKDEKVDSVDAMRDCLMALLFDVRQQNQSNCYAISSFIYATENSPYKVLSQMVEWIKKGHLAFSNTVTIPIRPIVEKRLIYEKDLTLVHLPSDRAVELTSFQNITSALHLHSTQKGDDAPRTLKVTLCELLEENKAEEELLYALRLYYTYKHNALVHMMLAMIEFQSQNSIPSRKSATAFSEQKQEVLNAIFSNIPYYVSPGFVQLFKETVGEKLWIDDCAECNVEVKKGKIQYGPSHNQRYIEKYNGDLKALFSVLSDSRRVFFLDNGEYKLIDSISHLQMVLVSVAQKINADSNNHYPGSILYIVSIINSQKFKRAIANFCASQIETPGISGSNLFKGDLLLLENIGGRGTPILKNIFNLNFKKVSYTANNAHQFLRNLYNKFHKIDSSVLKSPVFMVGTKNHIFTLSPSHLSYSWNNTTKFYDWIHDRIYRRALALRNTAIPPVTIKRIIDCYFEDNEDQKSKILGDCLQQAITYNKFFQLFLQKTVNPKTRTTFLRIFDEEIMKVEMNAELLRGILHQLQIACSETQFGELENTILPHFDIPLLPFVVARRLYKILINQSFGVYPLHQIEQIICDLCGLPQSVDIGDSNWHDSHREDPAHVRLIMRYHFGSQRLRYFFRENEGEKKEKDDDFASFKMLYPAIMN